MPLAGADEESELIAELEALFEQYGCNHIAPEHAAVYEQQLSHLPAGSWRPAPNMLRVTGRFERPEQRIAPWGYGPTFDPDKIPPGAGGGPGGDAGGNDSGTGGGALRRLLRAVQQLEGFDFGPPRDITLNKRAQGFFRLDPHIDPISDGPNVVIVSVGSGTVLSLSPARLQLSARRDEAAIAERSWTNVSHKALSFCCVSTAFYLRRCLFVRFNRLQADLDVRVDRGNLVLLTGDARYQLRHGTRCGVLPAAGAAAGAVADGQADARQGRSGSGGGGEQQALLCDWWGRPTELLPREECRWSVVFAFAAGRGDGDQQGQQGQ
eukprot:SAG22_NODE_569_length_9023_cov_14.241820_3_plen_323_part_00